MLPDPLEEEIQRAVWTKFYEDNPEADPIKVMSQMVCLIWLFASVVCIVILIAIAIAFIIGAF